MERVVELRCGKTVAVRQDGEGGVGASVWDCALVLAHYMGGDAVGGDGWWAARRLVVELGAGTGVCGLVAAARGAPAVVLTDEETHLPLLRENAAAAAAEGVTVAEYRWGAEPGDAVLPGGRRADLVVASDVVYDPAAYADVVAAFDRVADDGALILLAFERRTPKELEFFRLLGERYDYVRVDDSDLDEQYRADDIAVFRVTRRRG